MPGNVRTISARASHNRSAGMSDAISFPARADPWVNFR